MSNCERRFRALSRRFSLNGVIKKHACINVAYALLPIAKLMLLEINYVKTKIKFLNACNKPISVQKIFRRFLIAPSNLVLYICYKVNSHALNSA